MNEIAFYRTKSAIQTAFIPPTMKKGEKGGLFCERGGVMMFSGANGENRVYDWTNKITFGIGIADVSSILNEWNLYKYNRLVYGTTMSLNPKSTAVAPALKVELVHDPNKGKEGEGTMVKTFTITNGKPNKTGQPTYFMVVSTNQSNRVYVGLSEGEVEMLIGLLTGLLPKFIGWN